MRKPPTKARRKTQPVKGGLKGFAEARKPAVDLLRDIQSHVVAEGVKNAGVGRESHKIHVSELVKDTSCPRHMYYKLTKTEPTDPPAPAYHRLEIIWAQGHSEHAKWQRWLQEMGDLWGTWSCLVCEHSWIGLSPVECPECSSTLIKYDEVNLEGADGTLVGHADGAVPRLDALVEVKSFSVGSVRYESPSLVRDHTHKIEGKTVIDHEGLWNSIKRPLRSHLVQGLMYLWMCKNSPDPDYNRYKKIIFVYENKTTQATKTFEIKLSERHIAEFLDTLTAVTEAVENGSAPKRPALFTKDGKPCKECPFRTGCWGEVSDDGTESTAVPARRSRARSEATGGEAEVRPAPASDVPDSNRPRRHHRDGGSRVDRADDASDKVGRAPRRSVGDGRGGRAVGGRSEGEGARPRFARRRGEGRNPDQG